MKKIIFLILTPLFLNASPLFKETRDYVQPNGETLTLTPKGNQFLNWYETSNKDKLIFNRKTKAFEVLEIKNGEIISSGKVYSKLNINKTNQYLSEEKRNELNKIINDKIINENYELKIIMKNKYNNYQNKINNIKTR